MNKLNEKLAKWAGFEWWSIHPQEDLTLGCRYLQLLGVEVLLPDDKGDMPHMCICEDGLQISAPDFTNSLDACNKWLVPKAIVTIMEQQECGFDNALGILFKKWQQEITTIEFIRLALCLAIEKIIDDVPAPL